MASPSIQRITTLSQQIAEKSKLLTDYLTSKGLDAPSFDVNGLEEWPISPEDQDAFQARLELVALTKELHDLSVGPKESLRYLAWDNVSALSLQAIWEFRVPEAVPVDGMISYEDLTAKVQELNNGPDIPVLNLRRLIRHAMTNRLFVEPEKGFVAHNRMSRIMLEDEKMNSWVGFMTRDLFLPLANVVDAMKKWPGSEEPTETGVNLAYKQNTPWFDYIQQDETFNNRYNLAMQSFGGGEGYSLDSVVNGYPWGDLPDGGTVVDMGGNQGYVSFAIAKAFPKLGFIVQDTAGMRTPETIGTVPADLTSRVHLTTHDFFTPQPVVADVYFMRMILHGFSDKYCIEILQALIPALKVGAKVVINDGGLPEPGTVGWVEERTVRTLDLFMQVTVNAREKAKDDWGELFVRASRGYRVNRVWKPEKARMYLVEAEWIGTGVEGDANEHA